MRVANGRQFLSIPGPTTVPDEVLRAMHRPAVDIYAGDLVDVTRSCLADLRDVFKTEGRTYIYAANGHGAWEAALTNVLSRGDRVLVLESGRFAIGWGDMGRVLGLDVEVLAGDWRGAVDAAALARRLSAPDAGEFKAILVVQVDTASGVINDIPEIRRTLDQAGSNALLMVDAIASLATVPFEMDRWGVDVAVTGSQKGLMMSPGLSFVAAGERAQAAHRTADLTTRYWDWTERDGQEHYNAYCGTPPEHLMFGLRKALDMLFEESFEAVFARHRLLAGAVNRAVELWAEGGALEHNIREPGERAPSVTTVLTHREGDEERIRDYARDICGVVVGVGIGDLKGRAFRIAHMGHVNAPMILGTLGALEMALRACAIPHGAGGVDAAIAYLAEHAGAAGRPRS